MANSVLGFTKINFTDNIPAAAKQKKSLFLTLGLIVGLILGLVLAIYFPVRELLKDVQRVRISANAVYTSGKNQDLEGVNNNLNQLKKDLNELDNSAERLNWISFFPLIGPYQRDSRHLISAAIYSVQALEESVNTIIPYADLLGLKGQSKFIAGTVDERIKTAIETIDKVIPNIDKIAAKLTLAQKEIEVVDFNRYPQKIGNREIRDRLVKGKELFSQTADLFVEAQPFLKKLPQILGVRESQRYLIIFQNDAELRATGGFMTAFAIFKVDKGKLTVERSDDIYKLDEAKKRQFPAPEKILTYHKDVKNYQLRDSNLSPDFVVSMNAFEKLLSDSDVDLGQYNGIIALDTHVLVETVKILGEFSIAGRSFGGELDARCDCPKVIYELEDYATRPVAYLREDRKGIIGTLLYQIMQRALGVSPSQYWGKLFQMFLSEAQQKHILFYFKDEEAQKGIESLNFAGRIKEFEGDYLHVNNVNFAGAKSNLFVENIAKLEINREGGEIINSLSLTYKNPAPASNCNLEAGQLCLNGILRNWLRIYVPLGSTLIEFTGSEQPTLSYEETGKTVFEGFLTIKPQGSAEVKVKYKLPKKLISQKPYTLLIQKQPGTDKDEFEVNFNKFHDKFILETDKTLIIP